MEKMKEEIKAAKDEMKEAKEEVKEATEEVKEAKEQIIEAKQEMRQASETMKEAMLAQKKKGEKERAALAAEVERVEREIRSRVVTVMTTALAVVAGLFWQTAINDTIKTFIPISGAWQYELIVATGVTVAAALAIYLLSKSTEERK